MRNYIVLFSLVGNGLLFSQPGTLPGQPPVENRTASSYACGAPVDIQAAISRAGRSGIESLVANHPGDFWVQRAYTDAMGTAGGMTPQQVAEAQRRAREWQPALERNPDVQNRK